MMMREMIFSRRRIVRHMDMEGFRLASVAFRAVAVIVAVIAGMAEGLAQTDAQFSQYYEVSQVYNPASVGNTDNIAIRAGGRMQWVGIENAPVSFLGAANMPFKLGKKKIGLGVVVDTEKYGLFNSLSVGADVAYKFKKFGGEWSVGLGVGMYDQRFRGTEVELPDDDDYHQGADDAIPTQDIHGTALDLSAGIWYHRPNVWAGLSATHLTSPTITMKSEGTENTEQLINYEFNAARTLYLMGGCNIPVKNTLFELMPSALIKTDFTFFTGEATLRARYNKFLIFGLGYRWQDAVTASVAIEIKEFFVGYAFDWSTTAIARASSGSHEVFLGYSMKLDLSDKNKNRHKSVRIM